MTGNRETYDGVWFIYDGACPLCSSAAAALRLKQEYGTLTLLDARATDADHPLMAQVAERGLDLDDGMVIYHDGAFLHGAEALRFMAGKGRAQGVFNVATKLLFRSSLLARLTYPWMRSLRNLLLKRRHVHRIDNLARHNRPIFKDIFGDDWARLPPVLQKHYANRPYTADRVRVEGILDVMCAGPVKWLKPMFYLMGGIPPVTANKVPVTVVFESNADDRSFRFNRAFHFKGRAPWRFRSRMMQVSGNEVVEIMRFGVGWRLSFHWEDDKVRMKHRGYVLALFGHLIPLPLTALLGRGYAEEWAVDDTTFAMSVNIRHPWWGKVYGYEGRFTIKAVTLA